MSAIAKTRPTEKVTIKVGRQQAEIFYLQKPVVSNLLELIKNFQIIPTKNDDWFDINDVLPEVNDSRERGASALRGARHKEEMTQAELAKKLNIAQGDLSKMENGKRPIGKNLAMRLGKILKVDYRIFL